MSELSHSQVVCVHQVEGSMPTIRLAWTNIDKTSEIFFVRVSGIDKLSTSCCDKNWKKTDPWIHVGQSWDPYHRDVCYI